MNKKGKILLSVCLAVILLILVALAGLGVYFLVSRNDLSDADDRHARHSSSDKKRDEATTKEDEKEEKEEKDEETEYTASITYEMLTESVSKEDVETVVNAIRKRLDTLGYSEAVVTPKGEKRVVVKLTDSDGIEDLSHSLINTVTLTFRDADGNVVLDGSDIEKATAMFGPISETGGEQHHIQLKLKNSGIDKFAKATAAAAARTDGKNYIAIMLDDLIISQPTVNQTISSDTCIISGDFNDRDETRELVNSINAGLDNLPFELAVIKVKTATTK